MTRSRRTLACGALALAVVADRGEAQTIRGRVVDAGTGQPVAETLVSAVGADGRIVQRARAGPDGGFALRLRGGASIRLRGERTGYRASTSDPLQVGPRDSLTVELRIAEQPFALPPLTVTARRGPRRVPALADRGFYSRQARGLGDFLDREDVERGAPMRLSQALDRVPGTTLMRGRTGDYIVFDRAAATSLGAMGTCLPTLYLDGVAIAQLSGVDVVQPESVEAVEMYHGPSQIPVEFNDSRAACGVILIWTRMGPREHS